MKNKSLNLLLIGRFVSDTGTRMQLTVLPLFILDFGGSPSDVGLFSFLTMIPLILFLPFGGVVGDRFNRKKIIVNSDLISGTIILVLGVVYSFIQLNLLLLIIVQVVIGVVSVFFESASGAMIPLLVKEADLASANSKVASLRTIAGMIGPIVGAALYSYMGITLVFILNGTSFLISAISEMFINYDHKVNRDKLGILDVFSDMKEGVLYIKNNRKIYHLCIYFFLIMTIVGPIFVIVLPLMFKSNLLYEDTLYGTVQAIQMVGYLAGVIAVGIIGKKISIERSYKMGNILLIAFIIPFILVSFPFSIKLLGNGSSLYFGAYSTSLLLFSSAFAFLSIPVQTIIQKTTPSNYMSRVFSIVGLISKGGMPLGAFLLGLILNSVCIHSTLVGLFFLLFPVILLFNYLFKTHK